MSEVVVATETFSTDIGGETINVHRGNRVPADHPMVTRNPHFFRSPEQETDFVIETARKAPGEKRSSKPKAEKPAETSKTKKPAEGEGAKGSDEGAKAPAEKPKAKD